MKFTAHIVIERPLEKVFLWMFQPQTFGTTIIQGIENLHLTQGGIL
jgi:hypothetical protein